MAGQFNPFSKSNTPNFNPFYSGAAADMLEVQRRQAIADALSKKAIDPISYDQRGAISPYQGLAKALEGVLADQQSIKATDLARALSDKQTQAMVEAFGGNGGNSGGSYGGMVPKLTGDPQKDMIIYSTNPENYMKGVIDYNKPGSVQVDPNTGSKYVSELDPSGKVTIRNLDGSPQPQPPMGSGGVGGAAPQIPEGLTPKASAEYQNTWAKNQAEANIKRAEDEKTKGTKASEMMRIIGEAKKELPNATGSGVGALYAEGKKFVGESDAQTQADRKLELYSGWLVSNVPRMEGPQSNFDVMNYQKMAADVGNRSLPIEDRMAALQGLELLQQKYAGGAPAAPSAPQAGVIEDGYRFKGGNPANPNSWEKVQ